MGTVVALTDDQFETDKMWIVLVEIIDVMAKKEGFRVRIRENYSVGGLVFLLTNILRIATERRALVLKYWMEIEMIDVYALCLLRRNAAHINKIITQLKERGVWGR